VLTLALSVAGGDQSVREVARKRFERLIVPWLFWAIVILLVRLARMALGAHDDYWRWPMLLYGPSDHLWFLPFAFAGAVILAFVRRHAPAHSVASIVVCAALAAALIMAPFPPAVRTPFVQWPWSLPSLPLGYALGRAIEARGGPRAARKDAAILCAAALVAFAIASPFADATQLDSLLRFGAGLVLLTAALFVPDADDRYTVHTLRDPADPRCVPPS
jgi:fucose 4-O-acetylase-like acetyltransferase